MVDRIMQRGKSSGRGDDNIETVKTRVERFFKETLPLVGLLGKESKVVKVDARGDREKVNSDIREELGKLGLA
jgi:adenylate kinase family enzyme